MRKIFLTAVVALMVSVQSLCGAAKIYEAHFSDYEKVIYPVVQVEDEDIEQKINAAIVAEIDEFLTGVYRNAQEIGAEVADIRTSYEIPCNRAGNTVVLSVVITESNYYKGAAHPATYRHALNFNLATGELMGIDYLTDVGEGIPKSYLIDKLNSKLLEKAARENISLFKEVLPLKELPQNFYWDENLHLHFIFQHYSVAPYAWGIIDIDVDD
jgi:hypothetical protein